MSLIASKLFPPLGVIITGMAAGQAAHNELGLSPELSNALTAFLIAVGGAVIRWLEIKIFKTRIKQKEEEIHSLVSQVENLKNKI